MMNGKLNRMKRLIEDDPDSVNYKMFTEEDKLQSIGSMARHIDNTGYALKSNHKKFSLTRKVLNKIK